MDPKQEARPLGLTKEIGSLRAIDHGESHFVGSSSGVFFVNTVRRAFAVSASHGAPVENSPHSRDPSPEQFIAGNDDSKGPHHPGNPYTNTTSSRVSDDLGQLPEYPVAKKLMMVYFKSWHPLFPFLHGPSVSRDLDRLYFDKAQDASKQNRLCCSILFRCIFNIALLDSHMDGFPTGSKFQSPSDLVTILAQLALHNDIFSVQTLLAAQLYLISVMSLRAASTVGGMIFKSIYNAGLHRCPYRYEQISLQDRDIRKRIFWSAYAIDRYLSQALGHPLGIQDSDIDVCSPGTAELHKPALHRAEPNIGESPAETILHLPGAIFSLAPQEGEDSNDSVSQRRQEMQATQSYFVQYGRLVGRALELFHKSIDKRWTEHHDVLFLKADIHEWWHELPSSLSDITQNDDFLSTIGREKYNLGGLFTILYHNLILIVNRPSLSLDTSTPEFRSALQNCIGSARTIITTLKKQSKYGKPLFWPGNMSSAWMAGLIIAFGCRLGLYNRSKALGDISSCLDILQVMARRWSLAKHCHYVLDRLLTTLKNPTAASMHSKSQKLHESIQNDSNGTSNFPSSSNVEPPAKKQKVYPPSTMENPDAVDCSLDIYSISPILVSTEHADGHGHDAPRFNDSRLAAQPLNAPNEGQSVLDLPSANVQGHDPLNFMGSQPNEFDFQSLFGTESCDIFEGITWEALNNSVDINEF
ncbi:C6 transcription factor [Phlyctema vagabunda]|uniref:C6 transcription factor n=1 Tax=Phlyctema vagabunda TaxID=108571 RepID=A0ABR4PDZ3_9HELO